jgi:hypothetical protein
LAILIIFVVRDTSGLIISMRSFAELVGLAVTSMTRSAIVGKVGIDLILAISVEAAWALMLVSPPIL